MGKSEYGLSKTLLLNKFACKRKDHVTSYSYMDTSYGLSYKGLGNCIVLQPIIQLQNLNKIDSYLKVSNQFAKDTIIIQKVPVMTTIPCSAPVQNKQPDMISTMYSTSVSNHQDKIEVTNHQQKDDTQLRDYSYGIS